MTKRFFYAFLAFSACTSGQTRNEIADRFKNALTLDGSAKLKECEAIAAEYPEDAHGMYCQGHIAEEKKDNNSAKRYYTQAITADPNLEAAYTSRGFLYASEGKHAAAAQDYDKASQINPANADLSYMAGWMYSLAQDWDSSIPKLKTYLGKAGDSDREKYLTASVHESVNLLNVFNKRYERTKNKAVQASIITEYVSPENNFCIKFKNLQGYENEIRKDSELKPAYEHLRKTVPSHILCKFSAKLVKNTQQNNSQIEQDCEQKIMRMASVFGQKDMKRRDWPQRKAEAIQKCVENGGEFRPGR